MTDVIPAILPKNFIDLDNSLARLRGVSRLVQIDLVGENIVAGLDVMPFGDEFDFEFDIMLPHPEQELAQEVHRAMLTHASRIVVHARAERASEALEMLQAWRAQGAVGVALQAHDMPEVLAAFDGRYDFVQVMGIDHEGRQGEPQDPHGRELELVRALHEKFPNLFIQVDGASAAHPKELAAAGASRLIVGSAIMHADDPKTALEAVYTKANA